MSLKKALFADSGIRAVWMNCATRGHRRADVSPRCDQPVDGGEMILRIEPAGQTDRSENVSMGFSLVNSNHVQASVMATVFADRVRDIARAAGIDQRVLLGLAIAHEIGHLLLSTNTHAATGLMRARWSQADLRRTKPSDWRFIDRDARAMQDELMWRISRCVRCG